MRAYIAATGIALGLLAGWAALVPFVAWDSAVGASGEDRPCCLDARGSTVTNLNPIGKPGDTMIDAQETTASLRQITAEQLRRLGKRQVVYLKSSKRDGKQAFALYGADGSALVVVDDVGAAVEMVARHGLDFVAVHW
jgi:hypothetical protein